jgi:hypothetical protein
MCREFLMYVMAARPLSVISHLPSVVSASPRGLFISLKTALTLLAKLTAFVGMPSCKRASAMSETGIGPAARSKRSRIAHRVLTVAYLRPTCPTALGAVIWALAAIVRR